MEREYNLEVQKIASMGHENTDLRSNLKILEEELARSRGMYEKS